MCCCFVKAMCLVCSFYRYVTAVLLLWCCRYCCASTAYYCVNSSLLLNYFFGIAVIRLLLLVSYCRVIGPLHYPVTWYKITHAGVQVAPSDFQNNATSTIPPGPVFVLEVPLRNLRTSMCNFVPCDRIVQRVYCCVTAVLLLCYCCVTVVLVLCYCCVTVVLLFC